MDCANVDEMGKPKEKEAKSRSIYSLKETKKERIVLDERKVILTFFCFLHIEDMNSSSHHMKNTKRHTERMKTGSFSCPPDLAICGQEEHGTGRRI